MTKPDGAVQESFRAVGSRNLECNEQNLEFKGDSGVR